MAIASHVTIAAKRRQDVLMTKILRPSLVFLRGSTKFSPEQRQGFSKTVRIEDGSLDSAKASLNIFRIGPAVLQCFRSSPLLRTADRRRPRSSSPGRAHR